MSFAYVVGPWGSAVSFKVALEWLWFWPKPAKRTMTFRVGMLSSDIMLLLRSLQGTLISFPVLLKMLLSLQCVCFLCLSYIKSRASDSNKKSREFTRGAWKLWRGAELIKGPEFQNICSSQHSKSILGFPQLRAVMVSLALSVTWTISFAFLLNPTSTPSLPNAQQ